MHNSRFLHAAETAFSEYQQSKNHIRHFMKKTIIALLLIVQAIVVSAADVATYEQLKQQLTEKSLPLVNITVDIGSVTKPNYTNATIEIADPLARTDGNVVTTFNCKIKYRGATSMRYNKKSFNLKLLDENGKSLDAPVLGNREDDSWILGAMAIDRVRMRDRLCFDIWNDMSQIPYETKCNGRNGTKGYFVEVFINGKYHGLYCMTDKVNRKLLNVKKAKTDKENNTTINGVMYKCAQWTDAAYLSGYHSQSMNGESWNDWELDYPDDYPCETAYTPLKNLIDYCTKTSDEEFTEGLDTHFYMQNLIDYHTFYLAVGLRDNTMKNSFMSINDINSETRMLITPWDLDTSYGGEWEGSYHNVVANNDAILKVRPYARLWKGNLNKYQTAVADRWRTLSKTLLSKEAFNARVDAYVKQFKESGAWEREYNAWNANPVELKQNIDDEANYIKTWFSENFDNLRDKLFAGIPTDIVEKKSDYETIGEKLNTQSLPLVNITVEKDNVSGDSYTNAAMEINDPLKRTGGSQIAKFSCKVKYHGEKSLKYDKKSFTVKLLNDNGKSLDTNIMNIREDDTWILDAMQTDPSRLRNRINSDIWNSFSFTPYDNGNNQRNGTRGYMVEVFINGDYHGLYCLTDKVNRKLLGLKKAKNGDDGNPTINGVMYKADGTGPQTRLSGYETEPMDGESWNEWTLEYPDDYPCEASYTPLKEFIEFCNTAYDKDFEAGLADNIYEQNLIDYHVFCLAQGLNDNAMNKTYLSIKDLNEGKQMLITPGNLDTSLGWTANNIYNNSVADNEDMLNVSIYGRLWNNNINDYKWRVAQRWKELSTSSLSEIRFISRVNGYVKTLTESGAWEREYAAWNGNPVPLKENLTEEGAYMKAWYSLNFRHMNEEVFKGITSGITDISESTAANSSATLYNVQGQKVKPGYKGIVIMKGKKLLQR